VDGGRRPKRVAHLIQETLSRVFLQEFQEPGVLITVTRVEMSADLQTAHVYLSFFGDIDEEGLLALVEKRRGHLRKSIATAVKLKYNPHLIFHRDPSSAYETRIEGLLERVKDEKK
jgi:ribosome-binding factor A